jgi:hypothetical protein
MTREDYEYIANNIGGDIDGFPVELVTFIVERDLETGWALSVEAAMNYLRMRRSNCFNWSDSPEGDCFWRTVIMERRFDRFFERFPEQIGRVDNRFLNFKKWN